MPFSSDAFETKRQARLRQGPAVGGELGAHVDRLRRGDAGVRVAHLGGDEQAPLEDQERA